MTVTGHFLILLLVALLCCAVGFYKYVYFISIGYGFAISGQGIAMLVLFREHLTPAVIVCCAVLILYGLRLSGFLLYREIKSKSYRRHMQTEIKDGSGMKLGVNSCCGYFARRCTCL